MKINTIFLFFPLFFNVIKSYEKCEICQNLVKEFQKKLKETENHNFGGGNTAWEESRLGPYETSETRLIDIVDGVCPTDVEKREGCLRLREEVEEEIEQWWLQEYRNERRIETLYGKLCVDHLKVCCHNLHYGLNCEPCFHQKDGILCSEHGYCDGNGTRKGKGSCICHLGYQGEACEDCSDGYIKLKNNNSCVPCDVSCSKCIGPRADQCEACAQGYLKENDICLDINECNNNTICNTDHYCNNTPGSYECVRCDKSCSTCTGGDSSQCIICNQGFQSVQGVCEDINECSADSQLCREPGQQCTNTEGSYKCECKENYMKQSDGSCTVKVAQSKDHLSSSTNNNEHNKNSQSTSNNKSKNKRQVKKIWTKKFEREFFKLLVCIILLAIVSYFMGRYKPLVIVGGLACGYYVYHKSISLDLIFSKSVYV